jgi:hypothetical protein
MGCAASCILSIQGCYTCSCCALSIQPAHCCCGCCLDTPAAVLRWSPRKIAAAPLHSCCTAQLARLWYCAAIGQRHSMLLLRACQQLPVQLHALAATPSG